MKSAPLIGVSTSEARDAAQTRPLPESDPRRREIAVGLAYTEAVTRAGGIPVVVPPMPPEALEPLLEELDGLLLTGGPDIDPATYGEAAHPQLGPTEPHLDAFELGLARRAQARELPTLGICRGAQLMNVARGGTLIQHLPDVGDGTVEHRQPQPSVEVTHPVRVAPRTALHTILGAPSLATNSFHHQGIERLGDGLRISGWTLDGVIEGIEAPGATFAVGVQWHAECLVARREHLALFAALVEAATARRQPVLRAA